MAQCLNFSYQDLITHYCPGPHSFSYGGQFIFRVIALAFPVSSLSHRQLCSIFIPLTIATTIHSWIAMGGSDVITMDNGLRTLVLLGQVDPRTVFRHVRKRDVSKKEKVGSNGSVAKESSDWEEVPYPESAPLSKRLEWVNELMASSFRLVDWKIGDPSHDRRQPWKPRIAPRGHGNRMFILNSILRGIIGYVALDLVGWLICSDPYFTNGRWSLDMPPSWHSTSAPPMFMQYFYAGNTFWTRCTRSLLTAMFCALALSQQLHIPYAIYALLVEIHLLPASLSPHNAPPLFRSIRHTLDGGLRGFWSKSWHQSIRYTAVGVGDFCVMALGIGNNQLWGDIVKTFAAFAVSGLVHIGLVPPQPVHATISPVRVRWYIFVFFILQAPALLVEDLMRQGLRESLTLELRRSRTGKCLRWLLNTAWLLVWSLCCFPLAAEATRQIGLYQNRPLPFSVVDWALTGQGWTWNCLRS